VTDQKTNELQSWQLGCSTAFFKDSLEGACLRIARLGFAWIDLICIPGWNHVQPAELAAHFDRVADGVERTLDRHGLRVHALNMAVPHLHQRDDAEVNRARIEQTRALVRLMVRLGVGKAGCYPGYYAEGRTQEAITKDTAESVVEMMDIAGAAGVVIGPEIHRFTPFETPAQARALLEAVPELTVVYDASHFIMQGIPLEETLFLVQRAHHFHFRGSRKDVMQCSPEESSADVARILGEWQRGGGAVSANTATIEYLPGFEGDVEEAIRATRTLLQRSGGRWAT
jgi:sugar phosphate isomerase/epimerase